MPSVKETIEQLVTSFLAAHPSERNAAIAAVDPNVKPVLHKYAWLKAEDAVKYQSEHMLVKGLLALVLENDPSDDPRHDVVVLALIFHSAKKLHLDAASLFAQATSFTTNHWLKEYMDTFPSRSPEHSDLEKAFWVHEAFNQYGFCYEQGPWTFKRKLWEKMRRLFRPAGTSASVD